jgi:wyosine [tRNA(Phe)-imidazoG37] synthetase (radical SAM superfamily)
MLVKGVNDSPGHIKKLKEAVDKIQPDKIQLNTVIRPPAEEFARPLSPGELEKIKKTFGKSCEVIADFSRKEQWPQRKDLEDRILSIIQRRPVTVLDIAASLGKHRDEVIKYLNPLIEEGWIKSVAHKDKIYYEPAKPKTRDR